MPEPIMIPAESLNLNAPDNNIAIDKPAEGIEKFSFDEFTGDKPVTPSPTPKVADKPVAGNPEDDVEGDNNVVDDGDGRSEEQEDTLNNTPENDKKTKEKVEVEGKDKGKDKDGVESDEGKEEIKEGEEGKDSKEDVKLHGNTKRDYSGFTAEQIKLLKRLDNPRFEPIAKEWRALQQAAAKSVELVRELETSKRLLKEGGVPPQWQEHPDAYQLSKEFQTVSGQYHQFQAIEEHLTQQLINIRQGKPWQDLKYNPQTKQYELGAQHEASDAADVHIQKQLNNAVSQKNLLNQKAEQIKMNHSGAYEKASTGIKGEVDHVVSLMHPECKPAEGDVSTIIKALPEMFRDHPLSYGYGKLGAIIFAQGRMLKKLQGELEAGKRIKQDIAKAGPATTPAARPSKPVSRSGVLSMKDFE